MNRRIGKVSSLSDVTRGVAIAGERIKVIEQPHQSQFVLYDVREDLAEEFNCANKLDSTRISPEAMKSRDFGKYVGALFRLKEKGQTGATVATLWRKQRDYWRTRSPMTSTPSSIEAEYQTLAHNLPLPLRCSTLPATRT